MQLRRKGLALLYYLAIEGDTRRELAADLLWGYQGASNNLRVELHRLRSAFMSKLGVGVFVGGADPLRLPEWILVDDSGSGQILDGLEDVSVEFQEWLERQRRRHDVAHGPTVSRAGLVRSLLTDLRMPMVIVVQAQPKGGASALAREMASKLRIPFTRSLTKAGKALHFSHALVSDPVGLAGVIEDDADGIWMLEKSVFGEDPLLLLALRCQLPGNRMRFLELGPLSWEEARQSYLPSFPYSGAASLYLASGGHEGYLREITQVIDPGGGTSFIKVPQRIRAAYQLELQNLTHEARMALERLSVHPGPYDDLVLSVLGAVPHMEELERSGWLDYDGLWCFRDVTAQRVLSSAVQNGRRARIRSELGEAGAYKSGTSSIAASRPGNTDEADVADRVPMREFGVGQELVYDEPQLFGRLVAELDDGTISIVRMGAVTGGSGLDLPLPEGPLVVHVTGHLYIPSSEPLARRSKASLDLRLLGTREVTVRVNGDTEACYLPSGILKLPLQESLDLWLYVEQGQTLRVETHADEAVMELAFDLYRTSRGHKKQWAFDLAALAGRNEDVAERADRENSPVLAAPRTIVEMVTVEGEVSRSCDVRQEEEWGSAP